MAFDFADMVDRASRSHWLPGLAGALVALRGAPGDTWRQRAFNVFCGVMVAGFAAPGVIEAFGLNSQSMQSAVAFGCGLFGMNLVAAVTGWIKETKLADVLPWVRRGDK